MSPDTYPSWLVWALFSAGFAALTAIFAKIGVEEAKVRVQVMLPGMLAMFAGPIQAMLQKKGNILLEDHRD